MDRGLYVIASGMLTELARQERIAHDLANSATPAYKAQHVAQNEFDELLLVSQRTKGPIGMASLGVTQVGLTIDFAQGALKRTDEQFDVGLDGEGFLVVATENGRDTRGTASFASTASAGSSPPPASRCLATTASRSSCRERATSRSRPTGP